MGLGLGGIISKAAPYVAFLQQLTSKDTAAINSATTSTGQLKNLVNCIFGRVTGFNPFSATSGAAQFPSTKNWAGIANPWTGLGLGMIIYGQVGKRTKWLPKAGQMNSIGKKILLGGAVGGFFDAPSQQTIGIQNAYPNQYLPQTPTSVSNTTGQGMPSGMRPF